ncbi:hypothetical protein ACP275_14G050800 [Erythranthe tilingii]
MSILSFFFFFLIVFIHGSIVLSCNSIDRDSLLSFHHQISSSPPLNWSSSSFAAADCCQWEGVSCTGDGDGLLRRVTRLWLPERSLAGAITDYSFLANLSFLSHLNLSGNRISGAFPSPLPHSIKILDLSSNRFNGSVDSLSLRRRGLNLIAFNISNNSFSGAIPSSVCSASPFLETLDFSMNQFTGRIYHGLGECSQLQILRAGFNSLSGWLPNDLYSIRTLKEISLCNNQFSGPIDGRISLFSNLTILELHVNEFTGEIPNNIGLLSKLEQLQFHTNSFNGTLPHSLTDLSNLNTLLLRNNHFAGEISLLDFSKLQKLQAIDLGNNTFAGKVPDSLCLCRSLTALRLAYNKLTGEIPPCMSSLKSLSHFSISDNYLSNVAGALKILRHCENLAVLFMSRCFSEEPMPDDNDLLSLGGFENLQILTLGGCKLEGRIPFWISKLRRIKVLNLSYNKISGPIPKWLGNMPSMFVLNLTKNFLTGDLPYEITLLPSLISDNKSSDLSHLALPFLFDSLQYNRLFNLPRGLKVGNNSLSGNIPEEIGRLKLLRVLDLSNNNFNGGIPRQLSGLVNLERLDMSGNRLSGKIPESLTELNFLSYFNVANNDLEGEIPRKGQFDTFTADDFEGNPKLCGYLLRRNCTIAGQDNNNVDSNEEEEEENEGSWYNVPFGLGYFVGVFAVTISLLLMKGSWISFRK